MTNQTPPDHPKDTPPPVLADAMLGRLCRWLRLMGYDTTYAGKLTDHQIAAQARAQGRTILTRDREMAQRRGIRCLLIQSQMLQAQIEQVIDELGAPPEQTTARCPACNTPLEQVIRDQVAPEKQEHLQTHVPPYIFETNTTFHYCATCNKYYWPGSHWQHVQSTIEQIRNEG